MSNTRRLTDSRRRTGLVEIVTEPGKVIMNCCPPGTPPVSIHMPPDLARNLARGLMDGADEAEGVVIVRPEDVISDAANT
jgi:hypothetical protein